MNHLSKLLEQISIVQYPTKHNFFGLNAKTKGSKYIGPTIGFNKLLKEGLIEPVQLRVRHKLGKCKPIFDTFYKVTPEGCKALGIRHKVIDPKGVGTDYTRHEIAKLDVVTSFVRLYKGWNIKVDYNLRLPLRDKGHCNVDAYIKMTKDGQTFNFLIELERRRWDRVVSEKIPELRRLKPFYEYFKEGTTKLLIVYAGPDYDTRLRPSDYDSVDFSDFNKTFKKLLEKCTKSYEANYYYLPFPDFYRLNDKVWYKPNGERVSLI